MLLFKLQATTVMGYMGVASFIGVEALIVVLGFSTVLPIAIPFVVAALAAVYLFREGLKDLWGKVLAACSRTEKNG